MKDTFLTVRYKTGFIHCCHNRTMRLEEFKVQLWNGDLLPVRSLRAAKIAITKSERV